MKNSVNNVTVTVNGKVCAAALGSKLSSLLSIDMLCGGHGKCGKCKVKAYGKLSEPCASEKEHLTEEELKSGVRLACMTVIEGDSTVETYSAAGSDSKILTDGTMAEFSLNPAFSKYGVAIDIGTTTLASRLYNAKGDILAQTSTLNPQLVFGADVVSRIEAALNREDKSLAQTIIKAIDDLIVSLTGDAGVTPAEIDGIVITGNTVMLSLLTNTSTEPLSHAPFNAERLFGEVLSAEKIGLTTIGADTEIYLPNCISAFVGADTVCALISTGICRSDSTELLADIGTNGEIALWHNGTLTVCSTAAGPAFEGVGISMGMRGETGAIDRVTVTDGKIKAHVIGNTAPKGICGSGLIDAVACLLQTNELDETGYLENDPAVIDSPVTLSAKDIRMVQLAKSAIHAGINTIIKSSQISSDNISSLHIAGGFGSYLDMESAGRIGLIPKSLISKVKVAGNSSLSGAAILLLNRNFRPYAKELADKATVLELSANPVFADEYMEQMMF